MVGDVARMVGMSDTNKRLIRKPEGKRLPGTHRRKREDNIKMDLTEIY
jgi:hypothetical protein